MKRSCSMTSLKPGGVSDEVVASPLAVALISGLDNALLHLKPNAEECFQLRDCDRLKILGVVLSGLGLLGLLGLLGSQVCLVAQEPPEIGVEEQLEEGKCSALMVDVVWDILGANVVSMELSVDPGDSLRPAHAEILGGGFLWLRVARFGGRLRGSPGGRNPSRPHPLKLKCHRCLRCCCLKGTSSR